MCYFILKIEDDLLESSKCVLILQSWSQRNLQLHSQVTLCLCLLKIYKSSFFCCLIDILHSSIYFFSKSTVDLWTDRTTEQFSWDLFLGFIHFFSKGVRFDLLVTEAFLLWWSKRLIIDIAWEILKNGRYLLLLFGMLYCATIY